MVQLIKRARLKAVPVVNPGKKYLTFTLGKQEYALDIMMVQEIRGSRSPIEITAIHDMPTHIKGIISFHDHIVPIVDLRTYYRLDTDKGGSVKVIIILNIDQQLVGIVVDAVSDIVELLPDQIKPVPDLFSIIEKHYTIGIGKIDERMVVVIDMPKLLFSRDLQIDKAIAGTKQDTAK